MTKPHVIVVGGNFAGLTAALELKHELGTEALVTVISASDRFVFNPSLIWLPFGKRDATDITFPLEQTLVEHGIEFIHAEVTGIDAARRTVSVLGGTETYDHLVLATGYRNDFATVPGIGPGGYAQTITTLADAENAGVAWTKFLDDPGPIVIAATQGASCFGAAYEFLFNTAHQLRKQGLASRVPLTFVTSEPFLGHFGMGGLPGGERLLGSFLRKQRITSHVGVAIDAIEPDHMVLSDGTTVPFRFAMAVPPFLGQDVVRNTPGLADARGYIPVDDTYQSRAHPEIYAAGISAQVTMPWQTAVPIGVPKTGFPTERMAKVAARNIASAIRGERLAAREDFGDMPAVCMMDAGNNGVLILADHMLPPRKGGVLVPGPQVHAMKVGFEKYFLWKMRHGYVRLP